MRQIYKKNQKNGAMLATSFVIRAPKLPGIRVIGQAATLSYAEKKNSVEVFEDPSEFSIS